MHLFHNMPKILFLFLFIFISCEIYEGAKVFEIANSKGKKYEVSLSVEVGEEFALKFTGNPTAGYTQVLLNVDQVSDTLKGLNFDNDGIAEYVADSKDKLLVGGAGNFYYKFKALKVTNEEQVLNFSYRRTWEKNSNEPNAIVKISVN